MVAVALLTLVVSAGCTSPRPAGDAAFCQQSRSLRPEVEVVEPNNITITGARLEALAQVAPPEIATDVATVAQAFTGLQDHLGEVGSGAISWQDFKARYVTPVLSSPDIARANDAIWAFVTSRCGSP